MHEIEIDAYGNTLYIESIDADYKSGYSLSPSGDKLPFRYRISPVVDTTPWFAKEPWKYLKEQYELEIDLKTSDALSNLLEHKWIDFCYLLHALKSNDERYTAIKMLIGPMAQIAKETGAEPLKLIPQIIFRFLVGDHTLNFNQMKAMLPDLIAGVNYGDAHKKHVFAEISDNEIDAAIQSEIVSNPEQWAKAVEKPAMRNWFVGQIMKKYQGKIDAARVKQRLDTF